MFITEMCVVLLQDVAVVRWASYMELRIQLQKDDPATPVDESFRLYPPYLVIKYGQQVFFLHFAMSLSLCIMLLPQ